MLKDKPTSSQNEKIFSIVIRAGDGNQKGTPVGVPLKISKLVRYVGEKCHLSCSLDSYVELSLVKSASAGYTSGEDLSSLRNELSKLSYVLVINTVNLVLAEDANLLSSVHRTEGTGRIVSFHFE